MADIIEQSDMLLKDFNSSGYISKYVMEVLPQLVAEIKRLQAQVENCHAAKNLHARRSEKLQEQLVAKDDLLTQNQLTIQMHHSNVLELQKELDRWQKIAIDEKLKYILERDGSFKFDLADTDHCPVTCHDCEEDCSFGWCPSKDFWRSIAAKELNLQVIQEAGYLKRLEKEFLDLKISDAWDDTYLPGRNAIQHRERAQEAAQVALEKIRKG